MEDLSVTNPSHGVHIERLGQVAIPVADLERAISFYRDSLGLSFLFQAPPGLAFFDCAGVRLMLALPESKNEHQAAASILYFTVNDLTSAHAELRERAVTFIEEPHLVARMPDHELWMASFKDSEGNTLALMSEVRQG